MTEAEQEAFELDEENPPEADPKTEFEFKQELDLNKLQVQNEGRQLGYLLVQQTKGETQLQLRRWISSANGWEAWRQLNLLHTTSKRSTHVKLLSSLMNPSFDTQPASFSQQYNAWKEQTVRYQQLSGENLPDFIKLTAVVNGVKGQVRHHVLMQLVGGSSFAGSCYFCLQDSQSFVLFLQDVFRSFSKPIFIYWLLGHGRLSKHLV